jgi:hypothetical protein
MPNYQAKNELTLSRQLKVQELAIPLFVTANATPASKTVANDEPAMLFINTEGISQITLANGAVDTAAELSAITFATATDATGVYSMLVRIGEQVSKVVSAQVIRRDGNEVISCTFPTGATTGISSLGDKIVLNADSAVNFATTNYDASLVIRYVAAE